VRFGGNDFSYFLENKLTKLANFVQFMRMPMFYLEDRGLGLGPFWLRHWTRYGCVFLSSGDKRYSRQRSFVPLHGQLFWSCTRKCLQYL